MTIEKKMAGVLVCRDFGTSTRAIATSGTPGAAYFALYNNPRALMRIFILAKASINFTSGAIILKFGSTAKTATLTHLYPRAYATDQQAVVQDNHASSLTNTVADGVWGGGDFPMALDPTIVATSNPDCPRLYFQVIGTTETSIHLNGTGTGVGGSYKNARDFLSGGSNGLGVVAASEAMPTTVGSTMDFSTLKSKVFGTSNDWNSWKTALDDMYKNLGVHTGGDPLSVVSNNLALAIGNLKSSWLVQDLPLIGAGVGLIDFLFGGGGTTPAKTGPTYFAFNLSLEGSAVTNYPLPAGASIPVLASKSNPSVPCLGSSVPILYNGPAGIFNLTKTPVLKVKGYMQGYSLIGKPTYPYRDYYDFQVKEDLQYQINSASGLVLDSIRAWIVMDPSDNVNVSYWYDDDLQLLAAMTTATNSTMHLESTTNGKFIFCSAPVDGKAFRYQTIQGPNGQYISPGHYLMGWTPDMTIKIKAVFHRQDNPSAVPVLFVATYEPDFEFTGLTGNWPAPPYPVVAQVANRGNMLSVPNRSFNYVTCTEDFSTSYIYSNSIPPIYTYEYPVGGGNPSYAIKTELANGHGYWVNYSNSRDIKYFGFPINNLTVNIPKSGWHMIGSISQPLPINKITSNPPGIIVSNSIFEYSGGYRQANTLEPGKGYWIKVNQNGQLILDASSSPAPPSPEQCQPPPPSPAGEPAAPSLVLLSYGAPGQSLSPTLSWDASSSATSYRLQVSTSSSFSSLVFDDSTITATSKQIGSLSYSTTYYWQVNAKNNNGTSVWSCTWWFTTQGAPQNPCDPISPLSASDQFTVTDGNGNQQQLLAVNNGRHLAWGNNDFEMPPETPPGIFNARFHSGKFIESIPPGHEHTRLQIKIKDAAYPITVSWKFLPENKTRYWLTQHGNGHDEILLSNEGSVMLGDQNNTIIIIAEASQPDPCDQWQNPNKTVTQNESEPLPTTYALKQNSPNPFNPSTIINYDLPEENYVTLKVYNVLGQEVRTLVDEIQDTGYKSVNINFGNLPSGIYFYRMQAGKFSDVKKMILIR
jgi:hypothetical protein